MSRSICSLLQITAASLVNTLRSQLFAGPFFCDFGLKHTLHMLIFAFVRKNGTGSTNYNVCSTYMQLMFISRSYACLDQSTEISNISTHKKKVTLRKEKLRSKGYIVIYKVRICMTGFKDNS